jgi:hypothetical protein
MNEMVVVQMRFVVTPPKAGTRTVAVLAADRSAAGAASGDLQLTREIAIGAAPDAGWRESVPPHETDAGFDCGRDIVRDTNLSETELT